MSLFIYLYMYMIGLLSLCFFHKHIFMCLLSLEFIVLSMFLFFYYYLFYFNYEFYFGMIFLTFMICEGVVGLSILVYLIRCHGNDYLFSFSVFLC